MHLADHERLVLNAVESGLETEIEIAELLLDLATEKQTRAVIDSLLVNQVLVLTDKRTIEFPTASDSDAAGVLATIGIARSPNRK